MYSHLDLPLPAQLNLSLWCFAPHLSLAFSMIISSLCAVVLLQRFSSCPPCEMPSVLNVKLPFLLPGQLKGLWVLLASMKQSGGFVSISEMINSFLPSCILAWTGEWTIYLIFLRLMHIIIGNWDITRKQAWATWAWVFIQYLSVFLGEDRHWWGRRTGEWEPGAGDRYQGNQAGEKCWWLFLLTSINHFWFSMTKIVPVVYSICSCHNSVTCDVKRNSSLRHDSQMCYTHSPACLSLCRLSSCMWATFLKHQASISNANQPLSWVHGLLGASGWCFWSLCSARICHCCCGRKFKGQ